MIWTYILLSYISLFSIGLIDNSRGPFFPSILKDLGVNDIEGAFFFVVPSLMAYFGSYFTPRLALRFGSTNTLKMAMGCQLLAVIGFSQSYSLWTLLFFGIFFGLAIGIVAVSQHLCIQEGAPETKWRRLFSGLHSMYAIAALIAPLMVSFFLSNAVSWRTGFLILGAVPLGVLLVGTFFVKTKENIKTYVSKENSKEGFSWEYLYLGAMVSTYIMAELSVSTRMVLYLERVVSMPASEASRWLAGFFLLLLAGRLLFTFFSFEKLTNRMILQVSLLSSFVFYLLGLYVHHVGLVLCGLTMAPSFAIFMNYLAEVYPDKSAQVISKSMAYSAFFIVSMHYSVGALTEYIGIEKALLVGPLCLMLSFVLLLKQKRSKVAA